jgi:cell division septal protein FtsQ
VTGPERETGDGGAVRRRDVPADAVFAVRRTAPARRRWPWRRWLLGFVVVAALGGGGWWVTQSGVFGVARISTGSYRFTDERALRAALAPLLGRNLWSLDQRDASAALARLPWVREVYLRRRLPRDVDLELIEWRPLLVVSEPGAPAGAPTLVLVEDGRVLPFPARLPAPDLPVLTGVVVERSATGPARLPAATTPVVLDLVAALEQSGLESVAPVDFVVARPDGFGIVLQQDEGTLLVGREQFADRLARYLTARDNVEAGLEVDLRFKDRLTVRAPERPADADSTDAGNPDAETVAKSEKTDKAATAGPTVAAKPRTAAAAAAAGGTKAGAAPAGAVRKDTRKDTRKSAPRSGTGHTHAAKERA